MLHDAIVASHTQIVTVGLKRTLAAAGDNGYVAMIRQALRETGARTTGSSRPNSEPVARTWGRKICWRWAPKAARRWPRAAWRWASARTSLWELCRARSLAPRYIACGPVWPTLTKAMPWRPQGLANLRWWQHMAGAPVVAIGGILSADQVRLAVSCGVHGVCVVRGLGDDLMQTVASFQLAFNAGVAEASAVGLPAMPTSSLVG